MKKKLGRPFVISDASKRRGGKANRPHGVPGIVNGTRLDYSDEELEFLKAIDTWRMAHADRHPSWAEVLEIAKGVGWRKVNPTA